MVDHGFALHKRAFRDAFSLRYGWSLEHNLSKCVCGAHFDAEHALSCPTGGLLTVRHDEVRDLLAFLMTEVS